MNNLNLFIILILLPYSILSQQNVDLNEQFEGSWLPSGWQAANFTQNATVNHSAGGSKSAAHSISILDSAKLVSIPFQVIEGEQFDTISFWIRPSALSLSGTMKVDIVGKTINYNLATVNLGALPNNTWVKYSYSYSVTANDTVSVQLTINHALAVGTIYVDDIRIHKSITLPVTLSYFTAEIIKNNVCLRWETSSEINNAEFEIYRSNKNSPDNWTKAGIVPGFGNTNTPREYT